MTLRTLILRSLRFHARSHLGVLIGAAIASAVLTGALLVGDSMRQSLRQRALGRLGPVHFALAPQDRFFSPNLVWSFIDLSDSAGTGHPIPRFASAALTLPGTMSREDGSTRANRVNVFATANNSSPELLAITQIPSNCVVLNAALAEQLHVGRGDEVLLRCRKPSAMSREMAVTAHNEETVAFRLKVHAVTDPQTIGDFSLRTEQSPPLNAFVRFDELSANVEAKGKANLLLTGSIPSPPQTEESLKILNTLLRGVPSISFLGLELRTLPDQQTLELRSSQIFLEPELVRAANAISQTSSNHCEILTLLANLIRTGTNSTPYSMVTAAGPPYTPPDLKDDEIVLSQWLADDLHAKPGDQISLTYFDPESGARLIDRTNTFRVHSIVPMQAPWADRTLMPDFPGIEKAESTSDWDAGFPLTYKIRPKDEDYWKKYKGTPKAFITLAAGQTMWDNRFGNLTAIRFPIPPGANPEEYRRTIETNLLSNLNLDAFGLRFEPVHEQALKGAEQSQDFGQLFLSFSFFLVVAALLLMALLFQFGLERRTAEIGILLALGFGPKQVRRIFLFEGATLALLGAILGAIGGAAYASLMLKGLSTIWRNAIGAVPLHFFASATTLASGIIGSVIVAILVIWLALRKQGRQPARELLATHTGEEHFGATAQRRGCAVWVSLISALAAVGILASAFASGNRNKAETFFSAACLLLIAGLTATATWLRSLARAGAEAKVGRAVPSAPDKLSKSPEFSRDRKLAAASPSPSAEERVGERRPPKFTLTTLAIRACARRRKRSLATIALLASGVFLIVAIGVFRLDANQDALKQSSGTGGFPLLGQSTLPVIQDLNTSEGRQAFGLDPQILEGCRIVPFRVREGDEASCLNLDRAQKPRLLGVKPETLTGHFTFSSPSSRRGNEADFWNLLKARSSISHPPSSSSPSPSPLSPTPHPPPSPSRRPDSVSLSPSDGERVGERGSHEIPAIADANSLEWALHKKVGDTIDYTDEYGRTFKLRLVGAIANSILQGNLIIDETEFIKRFPSESGYRMFLIDAPSNRVTQVSEHLSRAFQDVGLELTSTVQRLNTFNAVQNTYLGTFQILGGLGLLLGSAGLAIVVLRNMLERRGELGLLTAIGFSRRTLQQMTLIEHGSLLVAGLALGIVSAMVAVLPALLTPGRSLPYFSLILTLAAVIANGLLWTWFSTRAALRGNLLQSLRNE